MMNLDRKIRMLCADETDKRFFPSHTFNADDYKDFDKKYGNALHKELYSHCEQSRKTMPAEQKAALRRYYTQEGVPDVNAYLNGFRGGTAGNNEKTRNDIRHLTSLTKSTVMPKSATLFRGISHKRGLNVGNTITHNGFLSASSSADVARDLFTGHHSNRAFMQLHIPKGHPMHYRGGAEKEIILPPDSKMKIHQIIAGKDGVDHIHAEVLPYEGGRFTAKKSKTKL
jgi:hypothetical protein